MPNPTILVQVTLGDDGLPVCAPDPVPVNEKGANIIKWKINDARISRIVGISGLNQPVFNPPPSEQTDGTWRTVDNAAFSNNGVYKYDISVLTTSGDTVERDPEVDNDVQP